MRFLSNFDTELEKRLLDEYKKTFGEDKVISIHKSKYYYRRYIGLPLFFYTILLIISLYLLLTLRGVPGRGIWVFLGIFGLYGLLLFFKLGHKRVDYKMDFLIVTPKEVIKYEQTGMFDRSVEKIHINKIESTAIYKPGVRNSIFDIGTLIFLSEGSTMTEMGNIKLKYVDAVEIMDKKVTSIMGLNKK